jgi:hypothetical protein
MRRTGLPGVAAAVLHRGRLSYADGFGVRDLRTGERVTRETVFRLASVVTPPSRSTPTSPGERRCASFGRFV